MRWLLTRDTPLAAALVEAKQPVVPDTRRKPVWVDRFVATKQIATSSTTAYPVKRVSFDHQWDVLVLVDPLIGSFGYSKKAAVKWNRVRGRIIIMLVRNDPKTWDVFGSKGARGPRGSLCICRPTDIAVYVTNDRKIQAASATKRRSVLWRPGMPVGPLIATVQHALAGKTYTPPKATRRGRGRR